MQRSVPKPLGRLIGTEKEKKTPWKADNIGEVFAIIPSTNPGSVALSPKATRGYLQELFLVRTSHVTGEGKMREFAISVTFI